MNKLSLKELLIVLLVGFSPTLVYILFLLFGDVSPQLWDLFKAWRVK